MEAFCILPDERPFSFLTAEKRNCQSESTNPSCKKDLGGLVWLSGWESCWFTFYMLFVPSEVKLILRTAIH